MRVGATSQAISLVLAGAFGFSAPATADARSNWNTYVNVRYGYQVCYPANLFRAQPEAPNSDGRAFHGRRGAQLLVFGSNNVSHSTLAEEASLQAGEYLGSHGKVTYRAAGRGWVVISGDDGAGIEFYTKTFQRRDQFVEFQVKFPKAAAALYRPVVERLNRCFVLLKPAF